MLSFREIMGAILFLELRKSSSTRNRDRGNPTPVDNICLCSPGTVTTEFGLAHNINEALPSLVRAATLETGYLWIDAICINQVNFVEKDRQIPLMGDIYAAAKRTIVWLGPELPDDEHTARHGASTPRLLDAMSVIDCQSDETDLLRIIGEITSVFLLNSEFKEFFTPYSVKACGAALDTLLQRPCFARAWTFQEWVLPKQLHILLGHYNFSGESMFRTAVIVKALRLESKDFRQLHLEYHRIMIRVEARKEYHKRNTSASK